MIRALGLLVLAGWASAATAQSLSGLVEDETRRPVPGATVLVPRLDVGTITNAQGRFTLSDLPADTLTVRISFLGFEPVRRQVDLRNGDAQLNVVLTPVLTKLDEVVVTEDATVRDLTIANQPLAVLDARELDLERGGSFGELLDGLAGVTLLTTGPTVAKPVIRGLHSDRVRIINAGVPQEGQQWGGEHAPEIDPFSPNRIEVLKGAAGVEYGVGAIGGVIRVEPRPLRSTPGLAGAAHVSGHSNNWLGAGGLLLEGGSGQLPGLGWRVQGSTRVGGNARTPDYALSNTGFRESSLNTAVGFQRDRFGVEVLGSHFATTLGVFRGAHIGNLTDLQRAIDRGR
ncbi:MAG: carboxypeptidase-like regulatory domain-containing protein, partial [Bacteroidota bacterium]